jgi:hypothetical protein
VNIDPKAIQAIAEVLYQDYNSEYGADHLSRGDFEGQAIKIMEALLASGQICVSAELLHVLADPDSCYFDHRSGCQAHGYLSLEPGELCPQAEVRGLLTALPERSDHG